MVCNIFKILNGFGIIDNLNVKEYKMKPKYIFDFENQMHAKYMEIYYAEENCKKMITTNTAGGQEFKYPFTSEDYDEACRKRTNLKSDKFVQKWVGELEFNNWKLDKIFWTYKEITDYLGIIPFTPSVMINISPDWNAVKDKITNTRKIKILTGIIENYLEESQRYDYYSYVIENGADGEHIHAHIVAHINPNISKSVNTHLAKGNHIQQLTKYAKKLKGMEGIIKGTGVQKTFLRCEELVKDKLDYLVEELKPEGHKNKSVVGNGRVDKVLFTVK